MYINKQTKDFNIDAIDLLHISGKDINLRVVTAIARELLDIYNKGYDDAVKSMGELHHATHKK